MSLYYRVANDVLIDNLLGGTYDAQKPLPIDGFDVWHTISRGDPSPRTEILLNIDNPPSNDIKGLGENYQGMALRMGSMKLLMNVKNITWFKPPELGGVPPDVQYSNGLLAEEKDSKVLEQLWNYHMVSANNYNAVFNVI